MDSLVVDFLECVDSPRTRTVELSDIASKISTESRPGSIGIVWDCGCSLTVREGVIWRAVAWRGCQYHPRQAMSQTPERAVDRWTHPFTQVVLTSSRRLLRSEGTPILLIAAVFYFHVTNPRAGGNQNEGRQD